MYKEIKLLSNFHIKEDSILFLLMGSCSKYLLKNLGSGLIHFLQGIECGGVAFFISSFFRLESH